MTRAIGDFGKAGAVVSVPEFSNGFFAESRPVRLIVASDGMWDVFTSHETACAPAPGNSEIARCTGVMVCHPRDRVWILHHAP